MSQFLLLFFYLHHFINQLTIQTPSLYLYSKAIDSIRNFDLALDTLHPSRLPSEIQ